jgi:ABC-type uncharacterized transport system fused permease/ATPase subunit
MDQNPPSKLDNLISNAESYIKTRQELSKLIAVQKSSAVAAGIFSSVVIFLLFFFVIVFASVALAYAIAEYTQKEYLGFLVVAIIYLLFGMIAFSKRKLLLEKPVINSMIKNFFKEEDHD